MNVVVKMIKFDEQFIGEMKEVNWMKRVNRVNALKMDK